MRVAASLLAMLIAVALLALWAMESIVRVGTCGPAEGGGSCSPGTVSWLLLGGAVAAAVSAVLVFAFGPRR
jgi:hypothetical protein